MTTLTVTKAQLVFTFWTFNQNPFIFKMPFCRFKGDFGIDEDEEQMISGQLRQLHLIIVWFGFVTLEERLCSEKSNAQPQDGNFVQF